LYSFSALEATGERLVDPPQGIQETLVVSVRYGKPPRGFPGGALLLCVQRWFTVGRSP